MYCIVLYCVALYCIVSYCIELYFSVLYCIVLYCRKLHRNGETGVICEMDGKMRGLVGMRKTIHQTLPVTCLLCACTHDS